MQAQIQEVADQFREYVKANPDRAGYGGHYNLRDALLHLFGGVIIGAGSYGAVASIDILPGKVVKLMATPTDAWVQWAIVCRNNKLPYGIEVDYLEVNEELKYSLAVMPKYSTDDIYQDDYRQLARVFYESERTSKLMELGLIRLAAELEVRWDLHDGNWAKDGDRLVLLDPWVARSLDGNLSNSRRATDAIEHETRREDFRWFKKVFKHETVGEAIRKLEAGPVPPPKPLRAIEARDREQKRSDPNPALLQMRRRGKAVIANDDASGNGLLKIHCGNFHLIPEFVGSQDEFDRIVKGVPYSRVEMAGGVRITRRPAGRKSYLVAQYITAYRVPSARWRQLVRVDGPARVGIINSAEMAKLRDGGRFGIPKYLGAGDFLGIKWPAMRAFDPVRGRGIGPAAFQDAHVGRVARNKLVGRQADFLIVDDLEPIKVQVDVMREMHERLNLQIAEQLRVAYGGGVVGRRPSRKEGGGEGAKAPAPAFHIRFPGGV